MDYSVFLEQVETLFTEAGTILLTKGKDYPDFDDCASFIIVDSKGNKIYLMEVFQGSEIAVENAALEEIFQNYANERNTKSYVAKMLYAMGKDIVVSPECIDIYSNIHENFDIMEIKYALLVSEDIAIDVIKFLQNNVITSKRAAYKNLFSLFFFAEEQTEKITQIFSDINNIIVNSNFPESAQLNSINHDVMEFEEIDLSKGSAISHIPDLQALKNLQGLRQDSEQIRKEEEADTEYREIANDENYTYDNTVNDSINNDDSNLTNSGNNDFIYPVFDENEHNHDADGIYPTPEDTSKNNIPDFSEDFQLNNQTQQTNYIVNANDNTQEGYVEKLKTGLLNEEDKKEEQNTEEPDIEFKSTKSESSTFEDTEFEDTGFEDANLKDSDEYTPKYPTPETYEQDAPHSQTENNITTEKVETGDLEYDTMDADNTHIDNADEENKEKTFPENEEHIEKHNVPESSEEEIPSKYNLAIQADLNIRKNKPLEKITSEEIAALEEVSSPITEDIPQEDQKYNYETGEMTLPSISEDEEPATENLEIQLTENLSDRDYSLAATEQTGNMIFNTAVNKSASIEAQLLEQKIKELKKKQAEQKAENTLYLKQQPANQKDDSKSGELRDNNSKAGKEGGLTENRKLNGNSKDIVANRSFKNTDKNSQKMIQTEISTSEKIASISNNVLNFLLYMPVYLFYKITKGAVPSFILYLIGTMCTFLLNFYRLPLSKLSSTLNVKAALMCDKFLGSYNISIADKIPFHIESEALAYLENISSAINVIWAFDKGLLSFLNSPYYLQYLLAFAFFLGVIPALRAFGKKMVSFLLCFYIFYYPVLFCGILASKSVLHNLVGNYQLHKSFAPSIVGIYVISIAVPVVSAIFAYAASKRKTKDF